MFGHALVDTFVPSADDEQLRVTAEPARRRLVEVFPGGRNQYDALVGIAGGPDGLDRFEDRLGLEQHAFTASKPPIVDGPVTIGRPVPQIVNPDLHDTRLLGPRHHAVPKRPLEEVGEDGQDVKPHRSLKPSGRSTTILRLTTSISTQIDFANGISNGPPCALTSSSGGPPYSCQPSTVPIASPSRVKTEQPIRSV